MRRKLKCDKIFFRCVICSDFNLKSLQNPAEENVEPFILYLTKAWYAADVFYQTIHGLESTRTFYQDSYLPELIVLSVS